MTAKESDRELLTLAAKAAGIGFYSYVDSEIFGSGINTGELDVPLWNPLLSDGDAFRLAVKLQMDIGQGYEMAFASATIVSDDDNVPAIHAEASEEYAAHNGDMIAASRRAVVLVAAAIGKEK